MSQPIFFASPADWRAWLEAHHATAGEISVGFWKKHTARPSITWPESVDEALCFGWIDGVRHRIDDDAYRIRFTPRKAGGIWSQVNIGRYAELAEQGRIMPAGQAAHDAGKDRTKVYAYEREAAEFTPEETRRFKASPAAWTAFQAFAPSYRKVAVHRVTSAKGEATRAKRLDILIDAAAKGLKLKSATQVDDR
ncbi:MAG TPA: YdeI/OmpD-associated family protein [Phenylobacterium sp.]